MSIRLLNIYLLAGLCFGFLGLTGSAVAQVVYLPESPAFSENVNPLKKTEPESEIQPDFPNNRVLGSPQSSYDQREYSTAYSGRVEPKMGGATLEYPSDLLQVGLKYNSPLRTGTVSTNAEIRLGRVFTLDFLSLSSSLLYSDNVDRTDKNTHGGFINIFQLDMLGTLNLTERLKLSFKFGLIYLPTENTIGLAGFTRDQFSGRLFYGSDPYMLTKLTYDAEIGKWHLHLYDVLRSYQALYAEQFDFVGGNNFDEEDRTGRYAFNTRLNPGSVGGNDGTSVNNTDTRYSEAFIQVVNTVGGSIDRLLPTVTRFTAGAFHSDMKYYGTWDDDDGDDDDFPSSRDAAFVLLNSERESLRFKPFVTYRVFRSDSEDWSQEARGGVSGPVTENIQFLGSAGYVWVEDTQDERLVASAFLRHKLGPYTTQYFRYRRDLAYPEEDLENSYTYRIRQTLGPYVDVAGFVNYSIFEDLNDNDTGTTEWHTGMHFTFNPSSKTTFRIGGVYSRITYDNGNYGRTDEWTGVAQARRLWTDSWETVLTYQFQNNNSTRFDDSYKENLVVLTVTYYFGQRNSRPGISGTQPYDASALEAGQGGAY